MHPVPHLPFMLRGTLYDPRDIERFNHQDLHLSLAPGGDRLDVIDDEDVMKAMLQAAYVSANAKYLKAFTSESGVHTSTRPTDYGPGTPGGGGAFGWGVGHTGPYDGPPMTQFYEDVGNGGSILELDANRGFHDLTEVPWTIFGTGDWNDTISSVEMLGTTVTVLHTDVCWQGSTLTLFSSQSNLVSVGWNDRASSVETW